jgi:hypothetical protein
MLAATAVVAKGFALVRAGTWLVVESPLQRAPVAVVFGGTPFRAIEAAKLYNDGSTRQVCLTEGIYSDSDAALAKLRIEVTPEHAYNRQVLESACPRNQRASRRRPRGPTGAICTRNARVPDVARLRTGRSLLALRDAPARRRSRRCRRHEAS